MASIHILQFGGLQPELTTRLKPVTSAQTAHNCLLTDGTLRPQAQWIRVPFVNGGTSIAFDKKSNAVIAYYMRDAVQMSGEPFLKDYVVGAQPSTTNAVSICKVGDENPFAASVEVSYLDATVSYSRAYDSIKPVNRLYACSLVRKIDSRSDEGSLRIIDGQNPSGLMYEGDLVTINISISNYYARATHVRLYRTISGLDTGENVTNILDTNWHLVDELPISAGSITYIDGASATASPLDVCYSQNFHSASVDSTGAYFGLSESGWFVLGSENSGIQISERYMYHAWPVDNHIMIPEITVTDMTVSRDAVYVGTDREPYVISLAAGENGLQATVRPFSEAMPCLPGSLAATGSGAIYASGQGLVGLSPDGQQVLTREIANAGDVLYSKVNVYYTGSSYVEAKVSAAIDETGYGAYYLGNYFGFCSPVSFYTPA